jgi:hypothetical protein
MSVEQYPELAFYQVVNTSPHYLGAYTLPADGDLCIMQIRVYHKKVGPYMYTMKLEMAATITGPALCTSVTEEFSNVTTGQIGDNWIGHCVFSFDKYNLFAGETYHFRLITTGYNRPIRPFENSGFLAVSCDWLESLGTSDTAGAKAAIGVER